jgi:PAS domain S-box-containing protein
MNGKISNNPVPVICVGKDGTVLYSNEVSELLNELGVTVGEKLPLSIVDIVQKVITQSYPEKTEIKVGKRVYLVVFHPLPEQECANIFGLDITDHKGLEEKTHGSEAREVANLELADILDVPAVQSLMYDLHELTHITIALVDLKGNIPVSVGWQDICTKFHRVHPETCKHCVESDTRLSLGVLPGDFKLYKCKNNMWDVVTPLIVDGQHIGNIFSGQFFFDDEPLDYELFRSQARKYGFNEDEYIAMLEKVPRLSREAVNKNMSFFVKLANMISQLSHSNFKLARSLRERDILVDKLEKSREDLDRAQAVGNIGSWRLDVRTKELTWSDENHRIFGIPKGTHLTYETLLSQTHPDDREYVDSKWKAGLKGEPYDIEHRIVVDGKIKWVRKKAHFEFDKSGKVIGGFGITQDITERKEAEERLKLASKHNRSLIEANIDPIITIGPNGKITDVNNSTEIVTGYSREELIGTDYSNYFTEPEKAKKGYQLVFQEGFVRDYSLDIKHKDGHITPVLYNASVYRDEAGEIIGMFAAARDISELKKAEEKIQILANAVESSEDAIITESLDGVITSWNRGAEKIYGYSVEEALEKSISVLEPENLRGETKQLIEKIKRGERIRNYETLRLKKDGTIVDISVTLSPVFDTSGKLVAISTIARDITERKKAEEALRRAHDSLEIKVKERTSELEKAYESLMEEKRRLSEAQKIAHIGNWDYDLINDKLYCSDEMYSIFGHKPREGMSYDKLLGYVHPEDRSYVDNAVKKALNEKSFSIDHRIISADGEERIVHAQGEASYNENKSPIRIKGIVQDITERKRAEEKIRILANVVESSNDAIITESLEGTITSWNKGAEQIYGYSAEEVLGKNVSIAEPDNLKGEIKNLIEKIKQGEEIQHYKTVRLKKDGTTINISITYSPVFDASGKLIAISSMGRDITEQVNAERLLAKAEEARKKEIHHRIKNNLQVISSLLDLQAEKFRSRGCAEDSEVLNAFIESQDRVMSIALIHEELHEGRGNDTLNFSSYIKRLVENLFQTYKIGNINTNLSIELEENVFFDMDIAVPLGIIINELVSNSLKYAFLNKDNGKIQIKLHREDSAKCAGKDQGSTKESYNGTDFVLTISDNGIGIPEDFNLEDSNSLGLQLVETLVDQLGGEIELKRDSGTEFCIKFTVPVQNEK